MNAGTLSSPGHLGKPFGYLGCGLFASLSYTAPPACDEIARIDVDFMQARRFTKNPPFDQPVAKTRAVSIETFAAPPIIERASDTFQVTIRLDRPLPAPAGILDADLARVANDTEYGLVASVFGRDIDRVRQLCNQLDVGMLAINRASTGLEVQAPTGGWKASGSGDPEQGEEAIRFFTKSQTIYWKSAIAGDEFP